MAEEGNYRKHDYCVALRKDKRIISTAQGDICLRCGDRVDVYSPSVEKVKRLLDSEDLNSNSS